MVEAARARRMDRAVGAERRSLAARAGAARAALSGDRGCRQGPSTPEDRAVWRGAVRRRADNPIDRRAYRFRRNASVRRARLRGVGPPWRFELLRRRARALRV